MNPGKRKPKSGLKKKVFNAQAFLDSAGVSKKVRQFKRADIIFSQGRAAESVMYIEQGGVKITALSTAGKEAIIAILGPGDFFGEGCLAGQPLRMGNATAGFYQVQRRNSDRYFSLERRTARLTLT